MAETQQPQTPDDGYVIDRATSSISDLWKKEDYWAIWLGFTLLKEAIRDYRQWIMVLMAHYRDLLTARADDFNALVKLAYRSRSNYLLTLQQLSEAEKKLNATLKPHIEQETEGIADVIADIERHSTRLRRAHAQTVFP